MINNILPPIDKGRVVSTVVFCPPKMDGLWKDSKHLIGMYPEKIIDSLPLDLEEAGYKCNFRRERNNFGVDMLFIDIYNKKKEEEILVVYRLIIK